MFRDTFFKFRLSEAEKRAIERKALRADLSPSDFIRREVGLRVFRKPSEAPVEAQGHNPGATSLQRLGIRE